MKEGSDSTLKHPPLPLQKAPAVNVLGLSRLVLTREICSTPSRYAAKWSTEEIISLHLKYVKQLELGHLTSFHSDAVSKLW